MKKKKYTFHSIFRNASPPLPEVHAYARCEQLWFSRALDQVSQHLVENKFSLKWPHIPNLTLALSLAVEKFKSVLRVHMEIIMIQHWIRSIYDRLH